MQHRKGKVEEDNTKWYELPKYTHDPNKSFLENFREHVRIKKNTGSSAKFAQVCEKKKKKKKTSLEANELCLP